MLESEDSVAALLLRIADKDADAFRELYDRTAPRQLAIAERLLRRRDLAEEALQDAYVSIWQKAQNFRPGKGSAVGWVSAIVRRRAIDRLRASPWLRRETVMEEWEIPFTRTDSADNRIALKFCLDQLTDTTKRAIGLSYLYGLTHRELSRLLDLPLGTLKSQIRRGFAALKACMES